MKVVIRLILTTCLLIPVFELIAQKIKNPINDTSIYSLKTIIIQGKTYTGFLSANDFTLLKSKNEVFFKHTGDYFDWEFKDFDKDGYKDIYLDKGGNTPERFDLLLYIPSSKTFKQIAGFELFPAAKNIIGTNLFYSYHRDGCADMNWQSDLFYIKNFQAIRIANISGYECENSGIKDGVYINKISGSSTLPFKTLPIKSIHQFKNDKWGFIKKYWLENYKHFL